MSSTEIIYGVPFSQPVRALIWLMLLKKQPFELVLINPGSKGENGTRHPDYLAKNPSGTIPCLEEPDSGFCLGEAHAIMPYLCQKYGWTDMYPDDLRDRARIDQYLHYHHRNLREASVGMIAPKIRKDLNIPQVMQDMAYKNFSRALRVLDSFWLARHDYVAGNTLTIADLAAYAEIGQCQRRFTNVFDFSPFANLHAWLERMHKVDAHDQVHVVLSELGDISQQEPDMETIVNANKRALSILKQELEAIRQ